MRERHSTGISPRQSTVARDLRRGPAYIVTPTDRGAFTRPGIGRKSRGRIRHKIGSRTNADPGSKGRQAIGGPPALFLGPAVSIEQAAPVCGRQATAYPGSAGLTGRRQHKPIVFRKRVDGTTPLIQKALAKNQRLPRLVRHGRDRTTGKPVKLILHGVKIKSRRRSGPRMALKTNQGQEEIMVRYERLTVQNIGSSGQDG